MRVLRPAPHIMAFYDGRIDGVRLHGPQDNWLDDGGFTLGTCSYAIVDGGEALVYDTHMSLDHARFIRAAVEAEGARTIRVVLSHHHLDHIAGNAVFGDCEILANAATDTAMRANRTGAERADPPISPVIMATRVFDTDTELTVGKLTVQLRSFDIHSHDGLVLWLPETRTLFAGDTVEDTCTYVAEPDRLAAHLPELTRLAALDPARILPNHGAPEVLAQGGYTPDLIAATSTYVANLLRCPAAPELAALGLEAFVQGDLDTGALRYHPAYETVHRQNVDSVLALG